MDAILTLIDLAGSIALLLWGVHLVQSGVERAFGLNPRRTEIGYKGSDTLERTREAEMRVAPIALAIFGAMLGSSEAVAVTYSSSHFSRTVARARLPGRVNPNCISVSAPVQCGMEE